MRILIDALSARVGGGITYVRHMPEALVRQAPEIEFVVLLSKRYQADVAAQLPAEMALIDTELSPSLAQRWWYLRTQLPLLLRREAFDMLFAVAESSYPRLTRPVVVLARNPSAYWHTFSFGPQWPYWLLHRMVRQPLFVPSLRRARYVVFVSEVFRNEVCSRLRIPRARTRVVHHGLSPAFQRSDAGEPREAIRARLGLANPFLLSVSTVAPHKNYETLIRAFAEASRSSDLAQLDLVIAGSCDESGAYYQMLLRLVDQHNLHGRVHFVGSVDHADLVSYYQAADLFVFPSRLETFGHPLVEAMAAGTSVISSNLSVCCEICGDAASYFDPNDANGLATLVQTLMREPHRRREFVQRGLRRAQDFSWDTAAHQMILIFREAVESQS
jgi:glycosyltransferase involved in cell wall biosynthesis